MAQGRVQVGDLRRDNTLRPAAIQSDTYARPAAIPQDDNTARLAEALSHFSNSIGNLVPVLGATDKKAQSDADERALAMYQQRIGSQTLEQTRQDIDKGNIPVFEDKYRNAAVQKIAGGKYAESLGSEVDEMLRTNFDWEGGDPEAYLAQYFSSAMEKNQNRDPNFIAAASGAWDTYKNRIREQQYTYRVNQSNEDASNAAATYIHDSVGQMIKDGRTPEEIPGLIHGAYKDMGTKGSLGLDYKDLDKLVVNEANRLASSDPDVSIALLTHPRKDVPALASNPEYMDRATQIIANANKAKAKIGEKKFLDGVAAEDEQRVAKGIGFDDVVDLNYTSAEGTDKALTKKSREDDAVRSYLAHDEARAKENGETGGLDTTMRQVQTLRRSNLQHPLVEAKLAGMANRGAPDLLSNEDAKKDQVGRLELYKNLKAENKNTLLSYVKKEDADYAEAYYQGQRYLGMSPDEALTFAYKSANLDDGAKARVARERDRIDSAVKLDTGYIYDSSPVNSEMARSRITDLATRYVSTGVDSEKAITLAKKVFQESSLLYNGVIVDVGTSSARASVPDNFQGAVDAQVDNFLKLSKVKNLSKDDISLIQMGDDGRFVLVDKDDLQPVTDDKGRMYRFNMRDLRDWDVKTAAEKQKVDHRESVFKANAAAKGYVRAVDTDGSENWIDPKTREILELDYPDDASAPTWKKTGKRYRRGIITTPEGSFLLKRPTTSPGIRFNWSDQ